jgi:hypothetical protein
MARQGTAWQDKARQGQARQGKEQLRGLTANLLAEGMKNDARKSN